jgi:hypothetical protein
MRVMTGYETNLSGFVQGHCPKMQLEGIALVVFTGCWLYIARLLFSIVKRVQATQYVLLGIRWSTPFIFVQQDSCRAVRSLFTVEHYRWCSTQNPVG